MKEEASEAEAGEMDILEEDHQGKCFVDSDPATLQHFIFESVFKLFIVGSFLVAAPRYSLRIEIKEKIVVKVNFLIFFFLIKER